MATHSAMTASRSLFFTLSFNQLQNEVHDTALGSDIHLVCLVVCFLGFLLRLKKLLRLQEPIRVRVRVRIRARRVAVRVQRVRARVRVRLRLRLRLGVRAFMNTSSFSR